MSRNVFGIRPSIARATLLVLAVLVAMPMSVWSQQAAPTQGNVSAQIAQLPLAFEPNQGQADAQVKYLSRGPGYLLLLTRDEAVLALGGAKGKRDVVRLKLADSNRNAATAGQMPLEGKTNYFLGNDPSKWRRNVPNFRQVRYQAVYPGIDLLYYGKQNSLEHDFIVAPNADPSRIAFEVKGAKKLRVDAKGNLILSTAHGQVQLDKPFIFQTDATGKKVEIAGGFALKGSRVGFHVGAYDKSRELVIDPVLNYATYFGGDATTTVNAITVDSSGNAYITGSTASSAGTLTGNSLGAPDRDGTTKLDVFVAKINSTGTAITYTTIIGGTGDDTGRAIAVDGSGNAHIAGQTSSGTFPTTTGAYRTVVGNNVPDGFALKLNAAGDTLTYSTYLNGGAVGTDGADDARGIAVSSGGHLIVTGSTASTTFYPAGHSFGTDTTQNGGLDGFLLRLNPAGGGNADLLYGTYWGGDSDDAANGLVIQTGNRAVVAGSTQSDQAGTVFPVGTSNPDGTLSGTQDGFVSAISTGAAFIQSATCVDDVAQGGEDRKIQVVTTSAHGFSAGDSLTISDVTDSANLSYNGSQTVTSVVNATTFRYHDAGCNNRHGEAGVIVSTSRAVGRRNTSTYFGGNLVDSISAIAIDGNGDIYITGTTDSDAQSNGVISQTNTIQNTGLNTTDSGAATDAFVAKLAANLQSFTYSAYLGGTGNDTGTGIHVNPACTTGCEALVVGTTASAARFNSNSLQSALNGAQDGFIVRVNSAGNALIYSSYFGGSGSDSIAGVAGVFSGTAGAPTAAVLAANIGGTIGSASSFGTDATVTSSAANTATDPGATGSVVIARLAANNAAAPTLTLAGVDSVDPVGNSAAQTSSTVYTWTVTNTHPTNAATNVTLDVPTPQTAGAAATANLTADAVTSVTVTNGGFGYNAPPTASFVGGDGAGAVAGAVTLTNGVVTAVAVSAGGAGYTVAPNVVFTGGTPGTDLISIASTNNAGCTFKAGTATQAGGMTCVLGNVAAANGTASVQVTASPTTAAACANSPCPLSSITLNGRANAAEPSTVATGSVTTSIVPITNLVITGTANSNTTTGATYTLGSDTSIDYNITVTNNSGSTIAANDAGLDVLIEAVYSTDPLFVVTGVELNGNPMVLGALTQGVDGCFNDAGNNKVQCNVTSIAAGGTATVKIIGSFNAGTLNPAVALLVTTSKFPGSNTTEIFTVVNGVNSNFNIQVNYTGPAADLQITAFSEAADPVRTAQDVVYTVTADNAGPNDATLVTVALTPGAPNPANTGLFTLAENSIGDGTVPVVCTQPGGAGTVINCVIDNADMQAADGPVTFTVTGTLTLDANVPTSDQSMTANIITAGATSDPNGPNSTANVTTTVRREAAVSVSNFSAPTTRADGQTITYTFDVANGGLDNATGTIVTLSLPQNANAVTFSGNSFTNQACAGTTTVTCNIGTINAGASGIAISVTATPTALGAGVASTTFNGSITNIASPNVVSTGGTKTAGPIVTTIQRQTTISLANLVDTADPVASSANISYTLDVSNAGANAATNIKLDFTVPTGTTTPTAGCAVQAATTIRCNIASVGAGATVPFAFSLTPAASFVPSNQASATFSVTAAFNATASTEVVDSGTGTVTDGAEDTLVERRADLQLVTLTATTPVHEDGNITVQAQVTNLSGATATGVQVVFTFNHNYRFVSANIVNANGQTLPAFDCTTSTATTRTCNLPDLPVTTPYTFNVIVQPQSGIVAVNNSSGNNTTVNVSAAVSGAIVDTNGANNNQAAVNTEVQRQANLRASGALTLFNGSGTINSSATATYNLTVRNDGPNSVDGATVVFSFTSNVVASLDTSPAAVTAWGGLGTCVRDNSSQVTCTMAAGFASNTARSGAITISPDSSTLLASTNSATYDVTAFLSSAQAYDNGTTGAAGVDNSTAIVQTTVQRQADLRVVSKIAPAAVADGGALSYTINVTNNGPDAAGSVRLVDPLAGTGNSGTLTGSPTGGFTLNAGGATFVSPTIPAGVCTPNAGTPTAPSVTVVCMLGPLNAGQSATITISGVANIDAGVSSATFNNVATVDAAQNAGDPIGAGTQTAFETNSGNNSNSVVSTTVTRSADLVMVSTVSTPVLIGGALDPGGPGTNFVVGTHEAVRYDVTVRNNDPPISSTDVSTAQVQITLPATLTYNDAASLAACSAVGQVVTCPVAGTLTPGGTSASIFFVAIPAGNLPIAPNNNATITLSPTVGAAGNTDPDPTNNSPNPPNNTTIDRVSALTLVQTAPVTPIPVTVPNGSTATFNYTWQVSNAGPSNATGVVVTNLLPADVTFVSGSWLAVAGTPGTPGGNCSAGGQNVTCNLSTIDSGDTVTITVTVRPNLSTSLASKTFSNSPVVNGAVQDANNVDNSDTDNVELRGVTDLQVTIVPVQNPLPTPAGMVLTGDNQTWAVSVTNNGPYPAGGLITMTNDITANGTAVTFVGTTNAAGSTFSCTGLVCTLGNMPPSPAVGSTQTVNVTVNVPASAVTGQTTTLSNSALVTQYSNGTNLAGDVTDPTPANNTALASITGRAAADLGVTQSAAALQVAVGQSGNKYTVTVSNTNGRSAATNVVLTNSIAVNPSNSVPTTASGTPSQGTCNAATGLGTANITITCSLGTIASGASATVGLALTPTLDSGSGDGLTNTPSVTRDEVDPVSANNSAAPIGIRVSTTGIGLQVFSPTDSGGQPVTSVVITGTVTGPGATTITSPIPSANPGVTLPPKYQFGNAGSAAKYYTITNTTVFSGPIQVCISTPETFLQPAKVRIFLAGASSADDRTIALGYNQAGGARQVCGSVPATGLASTGSTFVVMEPVNTLPFLGATQTTGATVTTTSGGSKGTAGVSATLDGRPVIDPDAFKCMRGVSPNFTDSTCTERSTLIYRWVGNFIDITTVDPVTGLKLIVKDCGNPPAGGLYPPDNKPCDLVETSLALGANTVTLTVIDESAAVGATPVAVKQFEVGVSGSGSGAQIQTVSPGQTGTFSFSYIYNTNTSFSFTGTPALAANSIVCSAQPLTYNGSGGFVTSTVTVLCSTQGPVFANNVPNHDSRRGGSAMVAAIGLTGLPLVGIVLWPGSRRYRKLRVLALCGLIVLMVGFMASCGGGDTGSSFGGAPKQISSGTAKGDYVITVTANPAATGPLPTLTLKVQ